MMYSWVDKLINDIMTVVSHYMETAKLAGENYEEFYKGLNYQSPLSSYEVTDVEYTDDNHYQLKIKVKQN